MSRFASLVAAVALAALAACVPPRDIEGAIDQDISAARNVGPVSGALRPPLVPNVVNVPLGTETPQSPPAAPQSAATAGDPQTGRGFALETCTPCHVVAADQISPLRASAARDFRAVANDPDTTPIRLNIWLRNPHPTMPSLVLSQQQAADVVAYILSLRETH